MRTKQCLRRHIKTKKHSNSVAGTSNTEFFGELCKAFISVNIPLQKANHPVLKQFMKKYTGRNLPDASTLRKYYVEKSTHKTICKIKNKLSDNYIWVRADETIDIKSRCVQYNFALVSTLKKLPKS